MATRLIASSHISIDTQILRSIGDCAIGCSKWRPIPQGGRYALAEPRLWRYGSSRDWG